MGQTPDTYEIISGVAAIAKLDESLISFQRYAVNQFLSQNISRRDALETGSDPNFKSLDFLRLYDNEVLEIAGYCDYFNLVMYPVNKGRKYFYRTEEEKRDQVIKVLDNKGGSISIDGNGKVTKET